MQKIPLIKPCIPVPANWTHYLAQSYASGTFTNGGPVVVQLEKKLQDLAGSTLEPVLVNNATTGLQAVLQSISAPIWKSKVIVPDFTFAATAHSILGAGLKPKILDVCSNGLLDTRLVERELLDPDVVAIVFLAPFGYLPSKEYVKKLKELCDEANAFLIMDIAAGFGSHYPDTQQWGSPEVDFEVYSFHATKAFGIGEGGAVFTSNKEYRHRLNSSINFGFNLVEGLPGEARISGTNAKMSDFQAAVGLGVAEMFGHRIAARRKIVSYYRERLKAAGIQTLDSGEGETQVAPQVFPIFTLPHKADAIRKALDEAGIGNKQYYRPLSCQLAFESYWSKSNPTSEMLYDNNICLPVYEDVDAERVADVVLSA